MRILTGHIFAGLEHLATKHKLGKVTNVTTACHVSKPRTILGGEATCVKFIKPGHDDIKVRKYSVDGTTLKFYGYEIDLRKFGPE